MSRKYDSRTTIFSPEGRLYQVEYAMEGISHAGSAVGILTKEGIVLACEKKLPSKLLEESKTSEKMYKISDSIGCVVAGLTSDANILINKLRIYAQNHLFQFDEPIPVEQLVRQIADLKQSYTQFGGLRPFGISFLYAGYDDLHGYQLYQSDPSGNYSGWKATAIGGNTQAAQSVLKSEYKDDITLDKAIGLALRVLAKSVDSVALSSKKVDIAVMTKVRNAPIFDILGQERVDELIKQHAEEISKSREDHD